MSKSASRSLPAMLRMPPKLLPMVERVSDYKYFLIEGGRGSGKTQAVARFLLYLADVRRVRVFCGREIQNKIEDSVHKVLADLVSKYNLAFRVTDKKITHLETGSEFRFRGFREQDSENIKGIEGTDILWVDEAQMLSERSLSVVLPTIRKDNCKLFFTFNRYMRDDAIMQLADDSDTLHIKCNYFDNPFCPQTLKAEAEKCKIKSERDYNHIWLGQPLTQADDYLFSTDKLYKSLEVQDFGGLLSHQRVLGIDFAAQGNDHCVATILDRKSSVHWQLVERIRWDDDSGMGSIGRIVNMLGNFKPDVAIIDVGGMGHLAHSRLVEIGMKIERFDGASTAAVETLNYVNARAEGYYLLKDWFDRECLILDKKDSEVLRQLEKIKMKYRSDGKRILQAKVDMKKELGFSPDDSDSLMMAVWAAVKFLGHSNHTMSYAQQQAAPIRRVANSGLNRLLRS